MLGTNTSLSSQYQSTTTLEKLLYKFLLQCFSVKPSNFTGSLWLCPECTSFYDPSSCLGRNMICVRLKAEKERDSEGDIHMCEICLKFTSDIMRQVFYSFLHSKSATWQLPQLFIYLYVSYRSFHKTAYPQYSCHLGAIFHNLAIVWANYSCSNSVVLQFLQIFKRDKLNVKLIWSSGYII
jgi:hypothetical protein